MLVSSAESTVIGVPGDYPTIQAAVNAASPGDKIEVETGVWKENIKLNKTVTLVAKEKFSTIIHAENPGRSVVTITANNVQVIGFTIAILAGSIAVLISALLWYRRRRSREASELQEIRS